MQGSKATTRYGVIEQKMKKIKSKQENMFRRNLKIKLCLLILSLKLFRRTGQGKAFNMYRIPESNRTRKESVDMSILMTSRNVDRKTMQFIRISSRE